LPGLEGTINTTRFTIPAGQSRTVTGDLTINASDAIDIDGTLVIPPGVNVNLWSAGDIDLDGVLQAGSTPAPSGRGTGPYNTTVVGANIRSAGNHSVGTGGNLVFASSAGNVPATISIGGNITLPAGLKARNDQEDGQDGGAILIGGTRALQIVTTAGRACQAPKNVTVNGSLTAGDGGAGFDDLTGERTGRNVRATSTHGGAGGDLEISAATSLTFGAGVNARPGAGGRAGWLGRSPGGSSYLTAGDGTGSAIPGGNSTGTFGFGGDAGTVSIASPVTNGSATQPVVNGGDPGSGFFQPGNGGLGAFGGNVSFETRPGGKNSNGVANPSKGVIVIRGGNGGNGMPDFVGGGGGQIFGGVNGMTYLSSITVEDGFRGGNGYNGCSVTPPVAGTNGGAGGRHDFLTVTSSGRSFNGGDGGSYPVNPTSGGAKGTSGRDGFPGRICAEASRLLTLAGDTMVGGTVMVAGTQISLVRVHSGHVAGPEQNCDHDHMHGEITIDGYGPIEDPNPTGCGHGHVSPGSGGHRPTGAGSLSAYHAFQKVHLPAMVSAMNRDSQ
jgi:hypothetical protein